MRGFFASAGGMIHPGAQGGEVHVTLKNKGHYKNWDLEACAEGSNLYLLRVQAFDAALFPGYRHATTEATAQKVTMGKSEAKTYVFVRIDNFDEGAAAAAAGGDV